MTERPRLIVDCDPGHDDALALVLADVRAELVGITTVGGNAPLVDVTRNALIVSQVYGIDAPVHVGSARPLVAEPRNALEIHGTHGLAGPVLPELERSVASDAAIEWIIETTRADEGIWLVPIGPMTNVAQVLRLAPDVAGRIAGVSFMGGSGGVGNHGPVSEFNALVDPEALHVVLTAPIADIRMAGLDLTHQFVVDDALERDLRAIGDVGGTFAADMVAAYLEAMVGRSGRRQGGLHDPCAVLAVTDPEVITSTPRHVAVELRGELTRGMTVVDERAGERTTNVAHGHTLDHAAARRIVLDAVAARADVVGGRS